MRACCLKSAHRSADFGAGGSPIAVIATLLLAALLGAPAIRLLSLAARTGQRPELLAGLFFAGAGIGVPLRVLGAQWAIDSPDSATILNATGHVFFALGATALLEFTRVVFRPESARARRAAILGAITILGSTGLVFAENVNSEQSIAVLLANISRVAALGWAFVESRRYASMMQRRVALGLGDPVVADRFHLWSFWTGALAMGPGLAAIGRMLSHVAAAFLGMDGEWQAHALIGTVINGLRILMLLCAPIAVYGIWMSFFPPASYLARIRASAATAPGASTHS